MDKRSILDEILKNLPKGRGSNQEKERHNYFVNQIAQLLEQLENAGNTINSLRGENQGVDGNDFQVAALQNLLNTRLEVAKSFLSHSSIVSNKVSFDKDLFENVVNTIMEPWTPKINEIRQKEEASREAAREALAEASKAPKKSKLNLIT